MSILVSSSMLFRSYLPRAHLREFVRDFWLYENYEGEHQRELILPSGTFEMLFNLHEDELRIYSPRSRSSAIALPGRLSQWGCTQGWTVL